LVGRQGLNDLGALRVRRLFEGEDGNPGADGKKYGKAGKDVLVEVPIGTVAWEDKGGKERSAVGEVSRENAKLLVAEGGQGGRGNVKFASSTNKVPFLAEEGEPGESRDLYLAYWPFVDVAVISLPSAGKSQLLRSVSKAFPDVKDYPFSTREPVFGSVEVGWGVFTIIEIPSLCEGSHEGKGLGDSFLTCAMRARIILLLIDGTTADAAVDVTLLLRELRLYDAELIGKPVFVAINKIDLLEVSERLSELRQAVWETSPSVYTISALTGEGLEAMKKGLAKVLETIPVLHVESPAPVVKRLRRAEPHPTVTRDGEFFVVASPKAARIAEASDFQVFRARLQYRKELEKLGVLDALIKAGVKSGDPVRIGKVELEWE